MFSNIKKPLKTNDGSLWYYNNNKSYWVMVKVEKQPEEITKLIEDIHYLSDLLPRAKKQS